jgi:hypothetical protein
LTFGLTDGLFAHDGAVEAWSKVLRETPNNDMWFNDLCSSSVKYVITSIAASPHQNVSQSTALRVGFDGVAYLCCQRAKMSPCQSLVPPFPQNRFFGKEVLPANETQGEGGSAVLWEKCG